MTRWTTGALAIACLAGCGLVSDDGSTKMGKGIDTPDSAWVVVSATDLGKSLPPGPSFASFKKPLTTAGHYVQVAYRVTPKKEKFIFLAGPPLVDSKGREYKPIDDYPYTGGTDHVTDLNLGAIGEFRSTYDIPPDAKKIRSKIDGHHQKGLIYLVDLKL